MADDPLCLTPLLADPFFVLEKPLGRDLKNNPVVRPGQLIMAHQVYPSVNPLAIEVRRYDPKDELRNEYAIKTVTAGTPLPPHFPIKSLNLPSDENLYVLRGKKRPAIVLQTVVTDYYNRLYPEPYVWVAPSFTFKPRHKLDYRCQVAAMKRDHLFYMPRDSSGMAEPSVLRFEHIQPVCAAGIEPIFLNRMQSFLSDVAWAILQHRLYRFCSGKVLDKGIEDTIQAYGDLVLEAYCDATK